MTSAFEDPKAWSAVSEGYHSMIAGVFRRFNERLVADIPGSMKEAGRCLDLCCGSGAAAIPLAGKFSQVDAVDFSEGMLAKLGEDIKAQQLTNIHPHCSDVHNIHEIFEPSAFDYVWSSFGVFMIPDHREVFSRVFELLKPAGTFFFTGFPTYQRSPFHEAIFAACHAANKDMALPEYPEDGLHNPKYIGSTLASLGFEQIQVTEQTIPFAVADAASFWQDLKHANVQFGPLQKSLGDDGWDRFSDEAIAYLESQYSFPCRLDMTTLVSTGRKKP